MHVRQSRETIHDFPGIPLPEGEFIRVLVVVLRLVETPLVRARDSGQAMNLVESVFRDTLGDGAFCPR